MKTNQVGVQTDRDNGILMNLKKKKKSNDKRQKGNDKLYSYSYKIRKDEKYSFRL